MTALSRRQALASAGAVIVAGGAACAPIPALAGPDPVIAAIAAYMAITPELNAADEASAAVRGEAMEHYPPRPRWPGFYNDGTGSPMPASVWELDQLWDKGPGDVPKRNDAYFAAKAKIEAWREACRAIDAAHGVPEADARMKAVEARLYALYDAMTETPAATIAGLVARLEFLRDHQRGDDPTTLDAALEDARRLGGVA